MPENIYLQTVTNLHNQDPFRLLVVNNVSNLVFTSIYSYEIYDHDSYKSATIFTYPIHNIKSYNGIYYIGKLFCTISPDKLYKNNWNFIGVDRESNNAYIFNFNSLRLINPKLIEFQPLFLSKYDRNSIPIVLEDYQGNTIVNFQYLSIVNDIVKNLSSTEIPSSWKEYYVENF